MSDASDTKKAPWRAAADQPAAIAHLRGGPLAPDIVGTVTFWSYGRGTWVSVAVRGLPLYTPAEADRPPIGPHGFHLHERGDCTVGDPARPFQAAGGHWNPDGQPHGNHAGDFPVLFASSGVAVLGFYTSRFTPDQAVGTAALIHLHPDDYRTQPDGDAGPRLACGVVKAWSRAVSGAEPSSTVTGEADETDEA